MQENRAESEQGGKLRGKRRDRDDQHRTNFIEVYCKNVVFSSNLVYFPSFEERICSLVWNNEQLDIQEFPVGHSFRSSGSFSIIRLALISLVLWSL